MLRGAEPGWPGSRYVHIRIQQRNGKKSLTTIQARSRPRSAGTAGRLSQHVAAADRRREAEPASGRTQGLEKGFDYKKVLKAFKKGAPRPARARPAGFGRCRAVAGCALRCMSRPAARRPALTAAARSGWGARVWRALRRRARCLSDRRPGRARRVLLQRHGRGGHRAGACHPAAGRSAQECVHLPDKQQHRQQEQDQGPRCGPPRASSAHALREWALCCPELAYVPPAAEHAPGAAQASDNAQARGGSGQARQRPARWRAWRRARRRALSSGVARGARGPGACTRRPGRVAGQQLCARPAVYNVGLCCSADRCERGLRPPRLPCGGGVPAGRGRACL